MRRPWASSVISRAATDISQFAGLVAIALLAVVLAAIQLQIDPLPYRKYFGPVNPLMLMVGGFLLGIASLGYLTARDWFEPVDTTGHGSWLGFVGGFALLFAAVAVTADVVLRFPSDTNVPWPDAFLFYPTVAFFVEVFLHAAPLALAVAVLGPVRADDGAPFWLLLLAVASVEAIFQVSASAAPKLAIFSGLHVLVFGVTQLYVFQRFGFLPMYALRLAYYALWHIAWGAARLHLLFP